MVFGVGIFFCEGDIFCEGGIFFLVKVKYFFCEGGIFCGVGGGGMFLCGWIFIVCEEFFVWSW